MFPNHAPPTRFGIESGLRGSPNLAPGCYSPDAVSELGRGGWLLTQCRLATYVHTYVRSCAVSACSRLDVAKNENYLQTTSCGSK